MRTRNHQNGIGNSSVPYITCWLCGLGAKFMVWGLLRDGGDTKGLAMSTHPPSPCNTHIKLHKTHIRTNPVKPYRTHTSTLQSPTFVKCLQALSRRLLLLRLHLLKELHLLSHLGLQLCAGMQFLRGFLQGCGCIGDPAQRHLCVCTMGLKGLYFGSFWDVVKRDETGSPVTKAIQCFDKVYGSGSRVRG